MSKIVRPGWKNFVTGWMVLTIGLIPEFIYVAVNSGSAFGTLSASGSVLLIGGFFGILIGWPVEAFLLPRYKQLTLFKIFGTYSLVGLGVAVLVTFGLFLPPTAYASGNPQVLVVGLAYVLFMLVPYMVTMLIARGLYPVMHQKLFSLDAPNTPARVNLSAQD